MTRRSQKTHHERFDKRFSIGITEEAKQRLDAFKRETGLGNNDVITMLLEGFNFDVWRDCAERRGARREEEKRQRDTERLRARVRDLSPEERAKLRTELDGPGDDE